MSDKKRRARAETTPATDVSTEPKLGTVCRHGTFVHPGDFYIGKALDLFGEYSEAEVRFLCSLLEPGDVVVEAGAHIGTICVPMAKVVGPTGAVHAFEPQEEIRDFLRANVANNGLGGSVTVYPLALGEGSYKTTYSPNERNTGVPSARSSSRYFSARPLPYAAGLYGPIASLNATA